jgi:hypothetical protein
MQAGDLSPLLRHCLVRLNRPSKKGDRAVLATVHSVTAVVQLDGGRRVRQRAPRPGCLASAGVHPAPAGAVQD